MIGTRTTHEEFLIRAIEKHGKKYKYVTKYKNSNSKIKIKCLQCNNIFMQRASNHLLGRGCKSCSIGNYGISRRKGEKDVIRDFNKKHKNKYDYSLVKYTTDRVHVDIICKEHGIFKQRPDLHLQGRGCPDCATYNSAYKLSNWKNMCPDKPGVFYILRCWNKKEEFFKFGRTCEGISGRYGNRRGSMPYNYEIIKQIESMDREKVWKLERHYLTILREYRYTPKISFGGSKNECFKF